MTPADPCQPMPRQYSQTPATPAYRQGLGLVVVCNPVLLAGVRA
jgi:hypothetical protein